MRSVLACSIAGVVLLGAILTWLYPDPIWDETYHWPAIRDLAAGRVDRALGLPMLPGFHALVAGVVATTWTDFRIGRAAAVALSATTLVVFAALLKSLGRPTDGHALARFALQPLLVPFWALVYTDVAGVLAVLLALLFHFRRRPMLEGAAWLSGVLVRQPNVVWPLIAVAGRIGRARDASAERPARPVLPAMAALAIGVTVVVADALIPSAPIENRVAPNLGQLHMFLLAAAMLWLPIWWPHLVRNWRAVFEPQLTRPWVAAAGTAAVGLLALVFRNPHPWNADPAFLRNWPLVALSREPILLFPAGVVMIAFAAAHAHYVWTSAARRPLLTVFAVSALYIAPHALIDPRYFIVPVVLADLFTPYTGTEARRLALWYAALATGVAAWVLLRPGSGMI